MITCIVDQTVTGEDYSLLTAALLAHGSDVTFIICSALFLRKQSFVIAKVVTANAAAWEIRFQRTAVPAFFPGLFLGYII